MIPVLPALGLLHLIASLASSMLHYNLVVHVNVIRDGVERIVVFIWANAILGVMAV